MTPAEVRAHLEAEHPVVPPRPNVYADVRDEELERVHELSHKHDREMSKSRPARPLFYGHDH